MTNEDLAKDDPRCMPREVMEYDVLIVGAGPSGLAAAIRLKQLAAAHGAELSVCVIEKGAEVGAHLISGAVLEPRALAELFPDWKERGAPLETPVIEDKFVFMSQSKAFTLPVPPQMRNEGNYIISLGQFGRWLAGQAESLGVEIYGGFAGSEILYAESGRVIGVATGDMGIGKDGVPTARFTRGVELHAKQTIFAEGCRGSLTKQLFEKFHLREGVDPQTYGIGLKEVWEIDPAKHKAGFVQHSIGWPLDHKTYGGSFLYHWKNNLVSLGFVVGLDYQNPYLSPFEEFQRFKKHPLLANLLEGGKRISYGARALSEGGAQSLPRLTFPGGVLVGDAAGFLNVPKIKGNHTAMKSGMIAAEAVFAHLALPEAGAEVAGYRPLLEQSWLWKELHEVRNIRPGFKFGLLPGVILAAIETVLRGRTPWTLRNHADHQQLRLASASRKIEYPKPDGVLTFDRLSSVFLSNTAHEEDQPPHLVLRDPGVAVKVNYSQFASPETRYCPAGVYEIVGEGSGGGAEKSAQNVQLVINAQNCVHCKTCDIKDPTQNIDWATPEGGGGPNYENM